MTHRDSPNYRNPQDALRSGNPDEEVIEVIEEEIVEEVTEPAQLADRVIHITVADASAGDCQRQQDVDEREPGDPGSQVDRRALAESGSLAFTCNVNRSARSATTMAETSPK